MIGLVLVAHSAKLAEGVVELAAQMAGEKLRIGVAAGLDQPGNPLGTDATAVARAIDEVWSEDGVLVLMDLGSAVLSAELALDLLPEERRAGVLLTEAPLVEGAVAAAVAAALGEPLEKVAEEARDGLAPKAAHLAAGGEAAPGTTPIGRPAATDLLTVRFTVRNRLGLHARPAAALVRTAAGYDADVAVADLTNGRGPASARSLNAVATLGVLEGHEVEARASGPQAAEALAAIGRLAAEGFGEPVHAATALSGDAAVTARGSLATATATTGTIPSPASGAVTPAAEPAALATEPVSPPPAGSALCGLPVSPGIVTGVARRLHTAPLRVPDGPARDRAADWNALERALAATAADIRRTQTSVAGRAGGYEAGIFAAHVLFLEDEALLQPARDGVLRHGVNAARAWADAVSVATATWERLDDPYQRARAADLRSVGDQVLRHLLGRPAETFLSDEGIVIATDLTPAQTAALDRSLVHGIACAGGGPTSHSAILARSLQIPAVVALGSALLAVPEGTPLALDGDAGTLVVDPPAAALRAATKRRARLAREQTEARERASEPAVTRDGVLVQVGANLAAPAEVPQALAAGADGVGLLRTEFLFLETDHLPSELEQERAYRVATDGLGGRPLTIRTLDAGADKQLPYLPLAEEQNPFLGLRGIRLGLRHPQLLVGQLRAVLRVAAEHPVRVMFPMVTTVDEVRRARELLDQARESLYVDGIPAPERVEVGIMVEVPAAALMTTAFAPHVDFFSVGTNDLAQYVLAAERGNADVAALADALHPAVLRLIDGTTRAAAEAGRPVAVCGELAGDPSAVALLLGLGVTELSMAPARIPAAKQAVRATAMSEARQLAAEALAAESATDVRRLCSGAAR